MNITAQLREDHAELERMARAFRRMLAGRVPPSGIDLVEFRQAFSREILAHLHREDVLLYPQLLKSNERYVSTMAQAFLHEMGGLLDAYKSWALRWPTERALADWAIFGKETEDLLDALTLRIESENRKLYPLLERTVGQAPAIYRTPTAQSQRASEVTNS